MLAHETYIPCMTARTALSLLIPLVISINFWCVHRSTPPNSYSNFVTLSRSSLKVKKTPEADSLLIGNEVRCKQKNGSFSSYCDKEWGWDLIDDWLKNQRPVIVGASSVNCAVNEKTYSFCRFGNVTIDFLRAKPLRNTRFFRDGFFSTYGENLNEGFRFDIPGREHIVNMRDRMDNSAVEYDILEHRPTFIISNDDIFNLGHYMNDVMNVWHMSLMAGRNMKSSLLLNIDGFRAQGPAGGPLHRMMIPADPDSHGPFIGYYKSWFSEIKKATEYRGKKVKYLELYVPSNPYFPWFWNDWWSVNKCALESPSPLYQSFNLFLRKRWVESYGSYSLPLPDSDKVHIVIELRPIDFKKTNEHSTARHLSNALQLVAGMKLIPDVRVTAVDFTSLPFREQVALSHSAGVFISMHGAGTTHIFHSALGAPNCCALIELQPEKRLGYQPAQGYANLAHMYGLHYYRYSAEDGSTNQNGTAVNVSTLVILASEAVQAVRSAPTCLVNVRDTRHPSLLGFKQL